MDFFSADRFGEAILFIIALVLSVCVHEFGHAWAASRLGDRLPESQGRLSLNPVRHIDPIGTLLFPFLMIMSPAGAMFGWGRPVSTDPTAYTRRLSRPTGSMLVAIAGPFMNLLMAVLVSLVVIIGVRTSLMSFETGAGLFKYLIRLNLVLLFFNLLPIPPLDGGAVLAWALPRSMQGVVDFLGRWGFIILIGLMLTGILRVLMYPAAVVTSWWGAALLRAAGV